MYSNEHTYRLMKIRHAELLREAETERLLQSIRQKPSRRFSPRVAWALVGPAFALVLLSLII
jgi:hypothetical protein